MSTPWCKFRDIYLLWNYEIGYIFTDWTVLWQKGLVYFVSNNIEIHKPTCLTQSRFILSLLLPGVSWLSSASENYLNSADSIELELFKEIYIHAVLLKLFKISHNAIILQVFHMCNKKNYFLNRQDLMAQHRRFISAAGGKLERYVYCFFLFLVPIRWSFFVCSLPPHNI